MKHENCVTIDNNSFSLVVSWIKVLKGKICIKSISHGNSAVRLQGETGEKCQTFQE